MPKTYEVEDLPEIPLIEDDQYEMADYYDEEDCMRKVIGPFVLYGTDKECMIVQRGDLEGPEYREAPVGFSVLKNLSPEILLKLWQTNNWAKIGSWV